MYIIFITLLMHSLALQAQNNPRDTQDVEEKVNSLILKMTLEEKVGQMNQYTGFWEITGPVPTAGDAVRKYDHLRKGLVGAVLNVRGTENVRKLQQIVVQETRLGIPLLFGYDVIHGHKTLFPIPLAEAASWDLEEMCIRDSKNDDHEIHEIFLQRAGSSVDLGELSEYHQRRSFFC